MNGAAWGAGELVSRAPLTRYSAGDRRREDAGDTDALGVALLAGDRREGQDAGLLHLDLLRDDALAVRGLGPEVDLRALDQDADARDRLALLRDVDRQLGVAPDEQLLGRDLADGGAEHERRRLRIHLNGCRRGVVRRVRLRLVADHGHRVRDRTGCG